MPIVRIDLLAGRAPELKADLIRRVTAAVVDALGVAPEQVRVLLNDVPPENWAVAGVSMARREIRAAAEDGTDGQS